MYRNTRVLFAAAALSTAILGIVGGQAQAGVEKISDDRMQGGIVSGYAGVYLDDGCGYTYIEMHGQEQRGEDQNSTMISIGRYDNCNQTYTHIPEYSYFDQGALVVPSKKLLSAELSDWVQFAVEHCDYSSGETLCTPGEARVLAKWTGFGNTYQGHSTSHEKYGPTSPSDKFVYISHSRSNGAERDATVEMQLEIDGIPVDFSSEYAYGRLQYVNSGSFTMYRVTP